MAGCVRAAGLDILWLMIAKGATYFHSFSETFFLVGGAARSKEMVKRLLRTLFY